MARRWRPPPMNEGEPESSAPEPKVTVDEKVVRKMLQVNPALRDGRTTFQVKKDMEQGQAVRADDGPATGPVPSASRVAAVDASSQPRSSGAKGELEETFGFFIRGKVESFEQKIAEVAERRRALDEEEQQIRGDLQSQLASFLSMLDEKVVAMHGVSVLSRHGDLLSQLGLTPAQVLEMARQARR